jgi:hypothetical protein
MVQPTQSVQAGWVFIVFIILLNEIYNYNMWMECKGRIYKMYFKWLLRKKISIKQGEELLNEYCRVNGFDDSPTHWKKPTHHAHWFSYRKRSNSKIANNWVAYHPVRCNNKYSIWIDLVTGEIREVLRSSV